MEKVMSHIVQRRINSGAMGTIVGGISLNVQLLLNGTTEVHHKTNKKPKFSNVVAYDISDRYHKLTKKDLHDLLKIAGSTIGKNGLPTYKGKRWDIANSVQIRLTQGIPNNLSSKEKNKIKIKIGEFYIENGRLRKSNFDENGEPTQEAIDTLCKILGI